MKLTRFTKNAVLAVGGAVLLSVSASATPITWSFNGHTYEYFTGNGISWSDAQAAATAAGGYLATLTSADENRWVYDNIVPGGLQGQSAQAWIGGERNANGGWQWVTGETWSFTNWEPGEPNNVSGVEFGATINRYGTWTWNDEGSWMDGVSGYIVEKDSVPDGGLTAMLLGMGTLAVGFVRRKINK
jgi:hypothetical protein